METGKLFTLCNLNVFAIFWGGQNWMAINEKICFFEKDSYNIYHQRITGYANHESLNPVDSEQSLQFIGAFLITIAHLPWSRCTKPEWPPLIF